MIGVIKGMLGVWTIAPMLHVEDCSDDLESFRDASAPDS